MNKRNYVAAIHPGIFRITHDVPIPGLGHVHTYIGDGKDGGLVIIDTSLGWDDSFQRFEEAVSFLGRKMADVESIVLTHCHPDHVGLATRLQQASGAPVVCHPIAERNFASMREGARWHEVTKLYERHGYSDPGRIPMFVPLDEPETFDDIGETFSFAGLDWDVIHTPGHESGHIVLFEPNSATLIAGDALLGSITPHVGFYLDTEDPLADFLESLRKIIERKPSVVLAGHGRRFEDGAARAKTIVWHHQRRMKQMIEALKRASDDVSLTPELVPETKGGLTAMGVARSLFGSSLSSFTLRLAVSETLSHLEYMRLRGSIVRSETSAGGYFYSIASGNSERHH